MSDLKWDELSPAKPGELSWDSLSSTPPKPDDTGDFMRGAKVALGQTPAIAKGFVGAMGATAEKVFGEGGISTAVKNWGINGYKEGMEKLQPLQHENDDVTVAWDKAKHGDIGALVDWVQYGLGYGAGQLGETALTALAGAAIGSTAGPGGALGGAASGVLEKTGVKALAQGFVEKAVAKEAARLAGEGAVTEAITAQATKNVAQNIAKSVGAGAALQGYNEMQEVGSIYPDAVDQAAKDGKPLSGSDLAKVWGWGTLAAATESATDVLGLEAATGKIRLPVAGGRVARGVTGAAIGAGTEGAQEGLQTIMERMGAGQDVFSEEGKKDIINSMAMGALPGAVVGGGAGAVHAGKTPVTPTSTSPDQQQIPQLGYDSGPAMVGFPDGTVMTGAEAKQRGLYQQVTPDTVLNAPSVDDAIKAAETAINEPIQDIAGAPAVFAGRGAEAAAKDLAFSSALSQARDAEFGQAEQARRDADYDKALSQLGEEKVDHADALTKAQGFDSEQPTAMQLAMQAAQERRAQKQAKLEEERKLIESMRKPLALPAPAPLQANAEGQAGTPGQFQNAALSERLNQQRAADLGLTPDVRAAQEASNQSQDQTPFFRVQRVTEMSDADLSKYAGAVTVPKTLRQVLQQEIDRRAAEVQIGESNTRQIAEPAPVQGNAGIASVSPSAESNTQTPSSITGNTQNAPGEQNGPVADAQPNAEVAAPSTPETGGVVSGGGSVLAPDSAGNLNGGSSSTEMAAPSVRPVAPAGEPVSGSVADTKSQEIARAKEILTAAGITGTERTSTIAAVRRGELTADDVAEAHPAKAPEQAQEQQPLENQPAEQSALPALPQASAAQTAQNLTRQGFPSRVIQHPTRAGMYAIVPDQMESRAAEAPGTIIVDGIERPTTNSNGNPIAQTDEALRNFWRWFGDSKVVDAEGEPLVVYHGTGKDFAEFKPGKDGIWFAEDSRVSDQFGEVSEFYLSSPNHLDMTDEENKSLVDKIERELFDEGELTNEDGRPESLYELVKWGNLTFNGRGAQSRVIDAVKRRGYTGLKWADFHQDAVDIVHVVFRPEQIKSATGNRGTFDPNNPNILFSRLTHGEHVSRPVHMEDLEAVAAKFRRSFPGLPIHALENERQAPKSLRAEISRMGATGEVGGAFHEGQVYLFRSGLSSLENAEEVAIHEATHGGLSYLFGEQVGPVMMDINKSNLKVADRALAMKRKFGYSTVRATEEVLADMGPNVTKLKGWDRLVAWVRDQLRRLGFVKDWTDNDVQALVLRSLEAVRKPVGTHFYRGTSFSRAGQSSIIGDSARSYTDEQRKAFERTGRVVKEQTLKERMAAMWQDAGKKLTQGVVDQFAPVKDLDKKAYTLLRLSKGATGAFEALMHYGKLSLKDGAYDADMSGGVIDRVFSPIGKESTDFLYWVAGNRADRLAKEGRENLFTPDDIAAYKSLADGVSDFDYTLPDGRVTRDRTLIYADTLKKFNAFNKNVLDMAEQSGLIDGESRNLWEHEFYVPFYRVAEEDADGVKGMNIKKGTVRQEAFKKLKGGTEGLNDLLSNTLMNWAHLVDASAKNRAAVATLQAAEKQGAAHQVRAGEKGAVWAMENGKQVHYVVDDPYLLTALQGLEYVGLKGPAMTVLSATKHWLTMGVTASPFFKVRNLIRDSLQSIATSDLGLNPLANIKQGWKLTDRDTQEYVSALAGGGLIRFGTMLEGSEAARTRQLIKQGAKDEHILDNESKWRAFYDKWMEPAVSAYNELGNRGEEINRMALYDQLIKQGVDHAEASLMARDLMDFSLQGSFTTIRFLSQVVPFFNARLQGLYKLGRAANEDKAKFATVLGMVTLASLGLLAAYHDDDDWKKRKDYDRDNYWWFKFGGEAFRIPKPFEIGAMATLAERSAELIFDKEMTGKRFGDRVKSILSNQLSMNPTPQLLKPIMDVYANKDSFRDTPIESIGMEKLAPEYRYNANTSMVARGISTAGQKVTGAFNIDFFSPMQIDHLIQSYFSWLGAFTVGAADMAIRAASNEPTRPAMDYWKVATGGIVSSLEGAPSRYVDQMYQQAKELEQAYSTWHKLMKDAATKQGADREEALRAASDFRQEHAQELTLYRGTEAVKRQEAKLNERIRIIESSNLDPDQKREKINAIRQQQDRLARRLFG